MPQPSVTLLINTSSNDVPCTNPAGDANWVVFAAGDAISWHDVQRNHADPLDDPYRYPPIKPVSGSIEAPKTFLAQASSGTYVQIPLAGSSAGGQLGGATRYVFGIYIGGATSGVPTFEWWDSSAHATFSSPYLGGGTPDNSTVRGIVTTNAAPGSAAWAGTPLAGLANRLELDTAPLSEAKYLYFNLRMVLPSTFVRPEPSLAMLVPSVRVPYA